MAILTQKGSFKEYVAQTAADIYDLCYLDRYAGARIIIPEGTYSFLSGTPTKELILSGDRSILFDGDVTIQDAVLMTTTFKNSDFYGDYSNSTVTYTTATDRFERNSGNTWTSVGAESSWWMFVRDSWYTCDTLDLTNDYFYVNEDSEAYSLTTKNYIFCKTITGLKIEGNLKLDITDSSVTPEWVELYGLAGCDLSAWHIELVDCRTITKPTDDATVVRFRFCAQTSLPSIEVKHQVINGASQGGGGNYITIRECANLTIRDMRALNCRTYNDSTASQFNAFQLRYCEHVRLIDCVASGNSLEDAAVIMCHFYLYNCNYCLVRGHSVAPYSELGSESHYLTSGGTGNVNELLTVAA